MGTISARRLKDGSVVFTAQVRAMRDGKKTSISSTFDRRSAADAWIARKEADAKKVGRLHNIVRPRNGRTLADAIDRYTRRARRTSVAPKTQVLRAIRGYELL